ncbi:MULTISPECIES: hypothetical protein [unclassified Pseudofrankia]|uniref:hypothetical protein n=1 Tax=unclassified Pseudofrankia TaxID=2994372 RepID=UPI0008DB1E38|nr:MULTISPECIES: hypothetical protein [unclassified Pseudofrankia]MDT3446708.1 hypothetical protein [Pseudofrankia sp. BMG5.37]OHV57531.1 hypothetical protein BCD48_42985 [Pseudofrankia sp. BMG5.36]
MGLPFIHTNAPIYLAAVARGPSRPAGEPSRARDDPRHTARQGQDIQCSWVRLGVDGCRALLTGGVNDLGGILVEETISRTARSAETGADLEAITTGIDRPVRRRDTLHGAVSEKHSDAARRSRILPRTALRQAWHPMTVGLQCR